MANVFMNFAVTKIEKQECFFHVPILFAKISSALVYNFMEHFVAVAKKKNISKLLIIFVVLSSYFLFASGLSQAAKRKQWYDSVNVTGGITAALQGTSGNDDSTAETKNSTDFSYSLDLNLNSEIAPKHNFFVHIETGEGKGVNDNFATFISPNYDPFNTLNPDTGHQDITISQAFYEGFFLEEMLTADIGKMDIHSFSDENNFAGDENSQFMAGLFVRLPGTLFAELDDDYSPGIRFFLAPNEWFEVTYVVASAANDSVGKDVYHVGQVNIKPNVFDLEGNYRFYFIRDGRNYTKIDEIDKTATSNFGWGVSFDQLITENLGICFSGMDHKKTT